MYLYRTKLYPAAGRAPEIRAALEPWVKARQAAGTRIALRQRIFGPQQPFIVGVAGDHLQEFEQARDTLLKDAAFQALTAKLSPLLDAPPATAVLEVVPIAGDAPGGAPRYWQSVEATPAPGKVAELIALYTERATARRREGIRSLLGRTILGGTGLELMLGYDSFAQFEEIQTRNATDTKFQTFLQKAGQLAAATEVSLDEVLVAMPAAAVRELAGAASR